MGVSPIAQRDNFQDKTPEEVPCQGFPHKGSPERDRKRLSGCASTTALPNFLRASASFWGCKTLQEACTRGDPGRNPRKYRRTSRERFPLLPTRSGLHFFFFFFCVIHMVKNQRLAEEAQPPGPFRTANAEEPGRPQESRVAEEPREAGEPGRTRGHRTPKKPGKPWDPRRAENHSSSLRSRVVLGRLE